MNPITSCHQVKAVVISSGEGTNHYECPVCHQSVNFDGSNPQPPVPEGKLDEIVDEFSVHRPKGRPKGTLARRQMKNKLNKHIAALIDAEVAKAIVKQVELDKEYLLIVNDDSEDYADIAKDMPQIKLIVSGDVELKEIKEYLADTESMGG